MIGGISILHTIVVVVTIISIYDVHAPTVSTGKTQKNLAEVNNNNATPSKNVANVVRPTIKTNPRVHTDASATQAAVGAPVKTVESAKTPVTVVAASHPNDETHLAAAKSKSSTQHHETKVNQQQNPLQNSLTDYSTFGLQPIVDNAIPIIFSNFIIALSDTPKTTSEETLLGQPGWLAKVPLPDNIKQKVMPGLKTEMSKVPSRKIPIMFGRKAFNIVMKRIKSLERPAYDPNAAKQRLRDLATALRSQNDALIKQAKGKMTRAASTLQNHQPKVDEKDEKEYRQLKTLQKWLLEYILMPHRDFAVETMGKLVDVIQKINKLHPQVNLFAIMSEQKNWTDMATRGHLSDENIHSLLGDSDKPPIASQNSLNEWDLKDIQQYADSVSDMISYDFRIRKITDVAQQNKIVLSYYGSQLLHFREKNRINYIQPLTLDPTMKDRNSQILAETRSLREMIEHNNQQTNEQLLVPVVKFLKKLNELWKTSNFRVLDMIRKARDAARAAPTVKDEDAILQKYFSANYSAPPSGALMFAVMEYLERVALLYDTEPLEVQHSDWNRLPLMALKNLKQRLDDSHMGEAACTQAIGHIIARIQAYVINPYGETTDRQELGLRAKLADLLIFETVMSRASGDASNRDHYRKLMETDETLAKHNAAMSHMPEKMFQLPDMDTCMSVVLSLFDTNNLTDIFKNASKAYWNVADREREEEAARVERDKHLRRNTRD